MSEPSVQPLKKALAAIEEIRASLLPFVKLLGKANKTSHSSSGISPQEKAEAQAAIALAVGTLRYMGYRLRGVNTSKNKNDPLRMELDKMRKIIVTLRNLQWNQNSGDTTAQADVALPDKKRGKSSFNNHDDDDDDNSQQQEKKKRRLQQQQDSNTATTTTTAVAGGKIIDKHASERMVRAALASSPSPSSSALSAQPDKMNHQKMIAPKQQQQQTGKKNKKRKL